MLIGIRLPNEPRHARRDATGGTPAVLAQAATELDEYFAGTRTGFDVPLELDGTPFQREVWDRADPHRLRGDHHLRRAGASGRASQAARGPSARPMGATPIPIIVPCHRVVASAGIGGYGGGLKVKRALLALEGVTQTCKGSIDPGRRVRAGRTIGP